MTTFPFYSKAYAPAAQHPSPTVLVSVSHQLSHSLPASCYANTGIYRQQTGITRNWCVRVSVRTTRHNKEKKKTSPLILSNGVMTRACARAFGQHSGATEWHLKDSLKHVLDSGA